MKIGDRVRGKEGGITTQLLGEEGTIIYVLKSTYSVEFDNHINGHDCSYNPEGCKGKPGHCWNCDESEIELISQNYEIY